MCFSRAEILSIFPLLDKKSLRPLHYASCDDFEHAESVTLGGAVGSRDLGIWED